MINSLQNLNSFSLIIISIGLLWASVIVFFLIRMFLCRYWKINIRITLMKENNTLLQEILLKLSKDKVDIVKENKEIIVKTDKEKML